MKAASRQGPSKTKPPSNPSAPQPRASASWIFHSSSEWSSSGTSTSRGLNVGIGRLRQCQKEGAVGQVRRDTVSLPAATEAVDRGRVGNNSDLGQSPHEPSFLARGQPAPASWAAATALNSASWMWEFGFPENEASAPDPSPGFKVTASRVGSEAISSATDRARQRLPAPLVDVACLFNKDEPFQRTGVRSSGKAAGDHRVRGRGLLNGPPLTAQARRPGPREASDHTRSAPAGFAAAHTQVHDQSSQPPPSA